MCNCNVSKLLDMLIKADKFNIVSLHFFLSFFRRTFLLLSTRVGYTDRKIPVIGF